MKILPLIPILCAPTLAQGPVALFSPGDTLGTGDTVQFVESAEVDSSGRWIALVRTTGADTIVTSEGLELPVGADVPGLPGAFVSGINRVARDDLGNTYCRLTGTYFTGGFERLVIRNLSTVLLSNQDFLPGPDFSGAARMTGMFQIETNAGGDLMILGEVTDPQASPSTFDAIVRFELTGGVIQSANLELDGSLPPAGQTSGVNVFWTGEDNSVLGDSGELLWSGSLGGVSGVAYAGAGELLGQAGEPSPVPGRNWGTPFIPSLDVNAGGTRLLSGALDGSAATDQVYLLDGLPVLQEGDPAPPGTGTGYVILGTNPQLTDGEELIHTARFGGLPFSQDRFLLADDEVLVQEGLTITSNGQALEMLELAGLHASADGRWILFGARLAGDSASSLLLLERAPELGQPYCSAEPNSTGSAATTRATGSAEVAELDFRLLCDGMPVQQPGFFLASLTQANVPFAGGSQGRLCLGGTIARFNGQVQISGPGGSIAIQVDLQNIPLTPAVAVQGGDTWNFQTWYRDMNPGQTSNFALPVSVTFQ